MCNHYKNLFFLSKGFGIKNGLVVILLVQVNEPIIKNVHTKIVIVGLNVFNSVSFIKK